MVPIGNVRRAFQAGMERLEAARQVGLAAGYDSEEEEPVSRAATYLTEHDAWVEFTNFTQDQVESLWRPMNDAMLAERHRGPQAASTTMDQLIHYLSWKKNGLDYATNSKIFGLKGTSRFEDNLNRVRTHLLEVLVRKWWTNRRRPQFDDGNRFPMVGLIIDGHTSEISPPRMSYNDAKVYYDGKNYIYGLKNEVAVSPVPPHYCLFVSDHVPASVHDYELHKRTYVTYGEYLHCTPEEAAHVHNNPDQQFWPLMGDKGYTGPAADTHPLKRIVPFKGALLAEQVAYNADHKALRVVVEQFFGRCAKLFLTVSGKWKWDWSHFDVDYQLACLLANEHIQAHALLDEDRQLWLGLLRLRITRHEEKTQKKRRQVIRSRERTATRLAQLGPYHRG